MKTNLLSRAPMRVGGLFIQPRYDKDQESAGDIGEVLKAVTDLKTATDGLAKREELAVVNKAVTDLKAELATLKVGDDNRKADPKLGFKFDGEYFKAVMDASQPGVAYEKVDERLKAATGVSQAYDPSIGFIIPPAFAPGVNETPYTTDNLLSRVRNIPIDASTESVTLTYTDDQDRTTGIRGGQLAYWKAETDQMTSTKPKLRQIKLEPQELYSMAYATDKSLRNSPIALGAWLSAGMKEAVAFKIGDAVVNGDGAGKPRGLLISPDKVQVTKETSQVAATINEANLAKMWKRMPAFMRNNAVWLCNQDCEDQFDLMARASQGVTATINPNLDTIAYNRDAGTLKSRPIVFCEYCATLGTVGDIILWAPQHYLVATKTGQGPDMSMHLRFDYAETAFRFIYEIDGRSEFPGVFTPYKGSVTRAPIVTLETRS